MRGAPHAAAIPALAVALVAAGAPGGCAEVRDVALELHPASDALQELPPDDRVGKFLATGALDCVSPYVPPLAALCVQVYTLSGGSITMAASCHDAPGLASDADLGAFLRGLGSIAEGISTGAATQVYVRLLGYSSAARGADSLVLCGITPSVPGHVDESASPPTIALYLLCHDPAGPPSEVFDDYCASIDFVAIFP